jgi:hypothetical protein
VNKQLLLIGSIPLDTVEEVVRMFGPPLGPYLYSMPDGEVGDRRWWTIRMSFQVFNGHPELETVKRPLPDDGVERLVPRDRKDMWTFKVRDGVEKVRFGDPGWRLGFTKDALTSYFMFRTLRDQGLLPGDVRFQVSLPLVNSVVTKHTFPEPGDLERVRPGYEDALEAEILKIVEKIPAEDLALQWDCAMEVTDVYGGVPGMPADTAVERNVAQVRRLSRAVPEDVALGFHLCFGTFGGWPRFAPDDLGAAVDLGNAMIAESGRRIDWINIPVLDRSDDAFFAPLADLAPHGARVYLGAIHNMEGFAERIATARKFLPEFGVSAYCGFGRQSPSSLPGIIDDHLKAVEIAKEIGVLS